MRSYFYKEQLENSSKEELQETVNKMIEAGLISPNTKVDYDKPFDVDKYNERMELDQTIYMNSEVWEALWEGFMENMEDINDGSFSKENIIALALALKARVYPTDNETMEQIRQLVENKENLAAKEDMKDKYLWKAKSVCVYAGPSLPCEESYTDVRELTVNEAVSWYKGWVKHLNDYGHDAFTVYSMGLFYKKDGEWVLYEENN